MLLRIAHITLALLVFVSSTGAPLFRHYCMNRVKDVSLFAKAETCQPDQKVCSIHKNEEQSIARKSCCQDRVDYLKISSDLTDNFSFHHFNLDVIAIFPPSQHFEVAEKSSDLSQWLNYRPPPPADRAIHIWVQAFLC